MLVWVRALGIDSSNSLPDHAMFGRFKWKMHQFTLAKHRLAARSFQNPTLVPHLWLEALYALLWTQRRHLSMAPRLGRVSPSWERQATFLLGDSSEKGQYSFMIDYHRAAWRRSRLRNVVDDQCGAVEHKHTYTHVLTLWARDQWRPFCRSCGRRRVSWVTAV